MRRLIDADALAELLKREAEHHEADGLLERSYGVLDAYMDVLQAPTVHPEPPKMGKWIPCKKKLPEKYGFYLVSLNNGTTDFCLWNAMEFGWESSGIFSKCDEVTAWMPLPEPYNEEEGEL